MAETKDPGRAESKQAAAGDVSPEGVPYQQGAYSDVENEDNPGPFDSGEGKHSDLLEANQPEDS